MTEPLGRRVGGSTCETCKEMLAARAELRAKAKAKADDVASVDQSETKAKDVARVDQSETETSGKSNQQPPQRGKGETGMESDSKKMKEGANKKDDNDDDDGPRAGTNTDLQGLSVAGK